MKIGKAIRWITIILTFVVFSSLVYALTDQERLQKLEDKFLDGVISEKTYLELKKKYTGGVETVVQAAVPGEVYREDFESGEAQGWEVEVNYKDLLTMGIAQGGTGGSKYAYEIRRDSGKTDTMFKWLSPYIAVKGGKSYQLTMDQKNSIDTTSLKNWENPPKGPEACRVYWYDSSRKEISSAGIKGFGGPNPNWHPVKSSVLTAPSNVAFARIRLSADHPDFFGGLYWRVDNIRLIEK